LDQEKSGNPELEGKKNSRLSTCFVLFLEGSLRPFLYTHLFCAYLVLCFYLGISETLYPLVLCLP
jgi:hypothetical protein